VAAFNGYSGGVPLANLLNVATRIVHGANDMQVPAIYSRAAAATMSAQACPVVYDELFGLGYHVHRQAPDLRVFEWLLNHRRIAAPDEVVLEARQAGVTQSHWLTIHARRDPRRPATARARFFERGELIVNFDNVLLASAELANENADPDSLLTVVVNGRRSELSAPLPPAVYFRHTSNGMLASRVPAPTIPGRRHYRAGSWQQLFSGAPVLVVRGTAGLPAVTNRIATCADAIARWSFVGREADTGRLPIKDDVDVNDADVLDYNLIVLGTPEQNELTAALAADLTAPLEDETLAIGTTNYPLARHGLWLVHYNPLAPQRLVWLWASPEPYFYTTGAAWIDDWAFGAEDPPDILLLSLPTQAYVRATHFGPGWVMPTNQVSTVRLADCGASVSDVVARIGLALAQGTRSDCAWLDDAFTAAVSSVWSMSVYEAMNVLFMDSTLVLCDVDVQALPRTLDRNSAATPLGAGCACWLPQRVQPETKLTFVTTPAGLRAVAKLTNGAVRAARYTVLPLRTYIADALTRCDHCLVDE
jgi:hypothetical protein